jgi:hypothetical protein
MDNSNSLGVEVVTVISGVSSAAPARLVSARRLQNLVVAIVLTDIGGVGIRMTPQAANDLIEKLMQALDTMK